MTRPTCPAPPTPSPHARPLFSRAGKSHNPGFMPGLWGFRQGYGV